MKNLQPEVAAKYALIGIRPGKYNFKGFGEIDLSTLNLAKADALVHKGFPHLKLRQGVAEASTVTQKNLGIRPLPRPPEKPFVIGAEGAESERLRRNKQYVNKLLTMDWPSLSYQDKEIFFSDQAYFLGKKKTLVEISEIDRRMKSLHAKVKNLKDQQKLKEAMADLSSLDEKKITLWQVIDTWNAPGPVDTDQTTKMAIEAVKEKDRQIKNHKIYIFRAENTLPNMPEKTASQKEKKAHKIAEIERRKKELIDLGSPYEGKSS